MGSSSLFTGAGSARAASRKSYAPLLLLLLVIGALLAGCGGGGDETDAADAGPTAAEAQQAAADVDSEIESAAKMNDKALDDTVSCMNAAFNSGDANQVAACSPVCESSSVQCRTAADQLQTAFEASPDYVQTAYQSAYDAGTQALIDRAEWEDSVAKFAEGYPTSTQAEDSQSIQEMNQLAKKAAASKKAVQPALDSARTAFDTYVSGLSS